MKHRTFFRAAALSLLFIFIAAAAFLVSPKASSQDRRLAREAVSRSIESFDELTLEPSSLLSDVRKTGRVMLNTTRGAFELEVEPFDIRSDNYRAVAVGADGKMIDLPRMPSRSYRGTVVGMTDTHVRLVLDDQMLQGIIVTPEEVYYVQSERDFSNAAGSKDFVFYAASSVKASGGECGTTLAQKVDARAGSVHAAATKGITSDPVFAPKPEAEIATEADFEFTQLFGGNATNTNQDILNILTQVDALYDAQLGIKVRVVFQRAFTANNDPYTLTDSEDALNQFADTYNGSFAPGTPPSRDLTHMFTGKDFDGSTIGIAFISAICDSPDASYGISQSRFTTINVQRVGLTAHEMGHNFGANHTGPGGPQDPPQQIPGCDVLGGAIMQPNISSNATGFCQFSKDEITNHVAGTGGSCLTRLTGGCVYDVAPAAPKFGNGGGTGSVSVSTTAGCSWTASEGTPLLTITSGASGNGPGSVGFSVAANNGNQGPRQMDMDVAGKRVTVIQAASPVCGSGQISIGQTINADLATTDCRSGQASRPNAGIDLYAFTARAGQRIKIEMTATGALDTYLYLFGPDGAIVAEADDIILATNTNSRIPDPQTGLAFFTLPATGIYTIEATSFDNNATGGYTISLTDDSATNSAALSSSAFTVNEGVGGDNLGTDGTGFRVITVTRAGDASGTATVDFATSDGSAVQRKDYEQTLGTLVFGPNETSKTFTVFVPDDRFNETPETINITLSNPVGMTLGSPSTATLTVNSNDAANASSPVQAASFSAPFYVRQQYLDFLNREPDASGFAFWQNEINSCADEPCREVKRINVSAAFFLSIEFQNTGFLVERMYKVAYGDATGTSTFPSTHQLSVPIIRLNEFLPDTQRIGRDVIVGVGNWEQQLETNKNAFALEFVLRQRFLTAFPLTMTPAQVVDTMNQNAGSVLTQGQRDALVAQLSSSTDVAAGRASVLRQIAENSTLSNNERNRAFVLMQFYGILRRNPNDAPDADYTGYDFWLSKLNQFNGNFVQAEMVKAFITSFEYIDRFGTRP